MEMLRKIVAASLGRTPPAPKAEEEAEKAGNTGCKLNSHGNNNTNYGGVNNNSGAYSVHGNSTSTSNKYGAPVVNNNGGSFTGDANGSSFSGGFTKNCK